MQKGAETRVSGRDIKRPVRDTTERLREKDSEMGEGAQRYPGRDSGETLGLPGGGARETGRQ